MPELLQEGTWLLLDAAGPVLCVGLLRDHDWLAFRETREGFLEALKPSMEAVLEESGTTLPELRGCLLAAGPGSTLGLRLAAMFATGLLGLPALAHWQCLSYNNLSLACAGDLDPAKPEDAVLLAPWRRDRFHRVDFDALTDRFTLSGIEKPPVSKKPLRCVMLGNRNTQLPEGVTPVPYPAKQIPAILKAFPDLLVASPTPTLYSAEKPEFARWKAERHAAR